MKNILVLTDRLDNRGNPANGMRVGKALRKLGHNISYGNHTVKAEKLKGFNLILAFGTLLYPDRVKHIKRIAQAKDANTVFALWYFDACNPAFKHSRHKYRAMRQAVPSLDWLIMTDHSYPWEIHAKNFLHLMQGVDPDDFDLTPSGPEGRKDDVIFTGWTTGPFREREAMLAEIKKLFSLRVYGRNSKRQVYGAEFFKAYQKARVAFVPPPPSEVAKNYWSNRIYLATATGTPCVVGYVEGIGSHYIEGQEVLFFTNAKQACGAIQFLLNHPDIGKDMGLAARVRTLRNHTYEARARKLMGAIFA